MSTTDLTSGAPATEEIPDLLPARMLNEYAYCPRLFYLEWVQCEFADSSDTVEGRFVHRRVDRESGSLPDVLPPELDEPAEPEGGSAEPDGSRSAARRATSVHLSDPGHGLVARIDLVEFRDGEAIPIDYKRGPKPDIEDGVWLPERVQICAQGLVLRANGYRCDRGQVYFAESKQRVTVLLDEDLVLGTERLIEEARATAAAPVPPPPLTDSPKCPRCSLVGICLPDELNFLSRLRGSMRQEDVRRLIPARDDRMPLYVQSQGFTLGKDGEQLEIREKGKKVKSVRILDVSQVNVYGNVQVSTQLLAELCREEVPVCYHSFGGWFIGITTGMTHKNVDLRRRQHAVAADPEQCRQLSARFVRGKILNCRTLLRRNHKQVPAPALKDLLRLACGAMRAKDLGTLLGIEGCAARLYFSYFGSGMLRPPDEGGLAAFDFNGRNRRPPKDPINCLLSYLYSVLAKDLTITCLAVGFDPFLGFFHQPRYGRPALALDLMEEFRPLVADSVVLQLVNTGEIQPSDFITTRGACTLTPAGRRCVLRAYERRMETTIVHPFFGYSASYRRTLEIQTRLLQRFLTGEISEYPSFRTR